MLKFKYAINGLKEAIKHHSVALQFLLALCAIISGMILKLDWIEWISVIICIGLVISLEMMNTCIEKICNFISLEKNEEIKNIKDIAAGAVLVASFISLIIAFVILYQHVGG